MWWRKLLRVWESGWVVGRLGIIRRSSIYCFVTVGNFYMIFGRHIEWVMERYLKWQNRLDRKYDAKYSFVDIYMWKRDQLLKYGIESAVPSKAH